MQKFIGYTLPMKTTKTATLFSQEAFEVSVEASFTRGLPSFQIVGLASSAIQESKERVKSALLHNNFSFPPMRITLNLSPSDLQKDGTHFDLPIALSIALYESKTRLDGWVIFGELGLDGKVKSTTSLFALLLSYVLKTPNAKVIVPKEDAHKLAMISDVSLYCVDTLQEAIDFLDGKIQIEPLSPIEVNASTLNINDTLYYYRNNFTLDFDDVRGQNLAKRAAVIAAAGNHNLLLEGNPGSGKSMIAKRLSYILPPLEHQEVLALAKLDSLDGRTPTFEPIRPFRSPHHSSTQASVFGGGSHKAKIGEAGLAHLGILFFDELPHFAKNTLEALREPLEDKVINISRVNSKLVYETNFLFVSAMNPCPCGNLLSQTKNCRCSDVEIKRYKSRLSDPLLDRIDLYVTMQESKLSDVSTLNSSAMRKQVFTAFTMQKNRQQIHLNASLTQAQMKQFCALDEGCLTVLKTATERFALTARSIDKVIKVARTIADIKSSETIQREDILEALSYRQRN